MSVKRWTAYVADDEDGNDIFVAYASDARGEWVRYSDHEAEVERLREVVSKARDYIWILESSQDGYYRASESEEAIAYAAVAEEQHDD